MANKTHETGHKNGDMDTTGHERTFEGFVRFSTWGAGIAIVVLIFIALVNG